MEDAIIVYDVKHTLASGKGKIIARQARLIGGSLQVRLSCRWANYRRIGRECALTAEVALELAAELRNRKIHNLKKQIARLEAMQFEIVNEFNA